MHRRRSRALPPPGTPPGAPPPPLVHSGALRAANRIRLPRRSVGREVVAVCQNLSVAVLGRNGLRPLTGLY